MAVVTPGPRIGKFAGGASSPAAKPAGKVQKRTGKPRKVVKPKLGPTQIKPLPGLINR